MLCLQAEPLLPGWVRLTCLGQGPNSPTWPYSGSSVLQALPLNAGSSVASPGHHLHQLTAQCLFRLLPERLFGLWCHPQLPTTSESSRLLSPPHSCPQKAPCLHSALPEDPTAEPGGLKEPALKETERRNPPALTQGWYLFSTSVCEKQTQLA